MTINIPEITEILARVEQLELQLQTLNGNASKKYYTVKEAAKYLERSYMTVYRYIQRGVLRANRASKDYRIHISDLEDFRKKCTF